MQIPTLLKNSSIYTFVMVVQKGINFLLLPLFTAFLTPTDYGIQTVVTSVSSFLSILLAFGLDTAAQRFFYKYHMDKEQAKKMYGTVALIIICNSVSLGSLFIVAHKLLIDPIIGTISFYPYVLVGILYVIVNPLYLLYQSYLQTIQDGVTYGKNALLYTLTYVILVVILMAVCHLGVMAILLSQLIVAIIFFIYVIFKFVRKLYVQFDKVFFKQGLRYSLPMLPHTLAMWSSGTIDKLLVNEIRSAADTGIYGLGQQYASVMSLTSGAINNAYVPWFFQKADSGDVSSVRKTANALTAFACLMGVILSLFSKELLHFMISNAQYDGVYELIPFLVFSFVFQTVYYFFVNVLFLKDTGIIFIITITALAFNVLLNIVLIPIYGIIGAAIVCTITYFVKSIMALAISQWRNKTIRFAWGKMYILIFSSLGVVLFVLEAAKYLGFWAAFLLKMLIVAIMLMALLFVFKNEVAGLIHRFKSRNK